MLHLRLISNPSAKHHNVASYLFGMVMSELQGDGTHDFFPDLQLCTIHAALLLLLFLTDAPVWAIASTWRYSPTPDYCTAFLSASRCELEKEGALVRKESESGRGAVANWKGGREVSRRSCSEWEGQP